MFCSNCGHELNENDVFCPVCGTKNVSDAQPNEQQQTVETQADNPYVQNGSVDPSMQQGSNMQYQQPYGYSETAAASPAPKKKKKFLKIAIPVCAAAVILGGAVTLAATGRLSNWYHKTFSSPEQYLDYVVDKNVDPALTSISNSYAAYTNELQETTDVNGTVRCSVTLGDSLRSLAKLIDPALGDLENAGIEMAFNQNEGAINAQLLANLNSNDIATVNAYVDLENEEGYVQIPELSDSYLDYSDAITDLKDEISYNSSEYMDMMEDINSYLPDEDTLNSILERYNEICWSNMTDVKKSSDTLSAEGVEQKCTVLTINADGEYAYNTLVDLINELKDDDEIKNIIKEIDSDVYNEFIDGIEDASENIGDLEDDFKDLDANVEMKLYMDGKSELCGIEMEIDIEGEKIDINYIMPQNGSKFGFLCNAVYESINEEYFNISGSGTLKNDILNGDFSVSLNPELNPDEDIFSTTEDILLFTISDYDIQAAKDGNLNGTIELSTPAVSSIEDYSLSLAFQSDDANASMAATILSDSEEWLTITIDASQNAELSDLAPSSSDTCYDITNDDDIESYLNEIDIEAYVSDVLDKTGIDFDASDIIDEIESSLNSIISSDDDDFDDFDNDDFNDSDNDDFNDIFDNYDDDNYDDDNWNTLPSISNNSSEKFSSIAAYVASEEVQSVLKSLKDSAKDSGMTIDILADGNKMIYSYQYTEIETQEGMEEALQAGISEQENVFQASANSIKDYVTIDNPLLRIEYLDKNGAVIYSREFVGK